MGFNLKLQKWQDQYKKRRRISQKNLKIINKTNRLKLNMTEIKEQQKENKSSNIKELNDSSK